MLFVYMVYTVCMLYRAYTCYTRVWYLLAACMYYVYTADGIVHTYIDATSVCKGVV